jgi:hypothetical protein
MGGEGKEERRWEERTLGEGEPLAVRVCAG